VKIRKAPTEVGAFWRRRDIRRLLLGQDGGVVSGCDVGGQGHDLVNTGLDLDARVLGAGDEDLVAGFGGLDQSQAVGVGTLGDVQADFLVVDLGQLGFDGHLLSQFFQGFRVHWRFLRKKKGCLH